MTALPNPTTAITTTNGIDDSLNVYFFLGLIHFMESVSNPLLFVPHQSMMEVLNTTGLSLLDDSRLVLSHFLLLAFEYGSDQNIK